MIGWVFLDVGNVLLDEDRLAARVFQIHVDAVRRTRPELGFGAILAEREAEAVAGSRWPLFEVVSRHLDEPAVAAAWGEADREVRADYARLSPPIAGAGGFLESLAARFRLGLIANQGPECRGWLDRLGWLDRFEVVALSEEVGFFKPDPRLFRLALDRAGVEPASAWMVGDRIDNDVVPASKLGMNTAWVRWPDRSAKGGGTTDPETRAYLASLDRIAAGKPVPEVIPTVAADDLGSLARAILAF